MVFLLLDGIVLYLQVIISNFGVKRKRPVIIL